MDAYILECIRFLVLVLTIIFGIIFMIRAKEILPRCLIGLASLAILYYHETISGVIYGLLLGFCRSFVLLVIGGFNLSLGLVIILLPIFVVIHYIKH